MAIHTHTLILAFPKVEINAHRDMTREKLLYLINNNDFKIEYFGGVLDNQADYMDEEMNDTFTNSTSITFHFDATEKEVMDYEMNHQQIVELLVKIFDKYKIKEVVNDGKDVEVFIY